MEKMKINTTFRRENMRWFIEEVVTEQSDGGVYEWEKVTAHSDLIFTSSPKEIRTFFFDKRQVKDFHGNPLPVPRYIHY